MQSLFQKTWFGYCVMFSIYSYLCYAHNSCPKFVYTRWGFLKYNSSTIKHNEDAHNLHQNASSDKPIVVSAQSQTDNTLRTSLIPLRGFLETHKTNTETKKIPAVIKKFPLIWTTGRISSVDHYLVRSERVLVVRCGQTIWRNGCVPRALSHYTHVDQH